MRGTTDNFDHPCKGTCSGWQQGFEKGLFETARLREENERLKKAITKCDPALLEAHKELAKKDERYREAMLNWSKESLELTTLRAKLEKAVDMARFYGVNLNHPLGKRAREFLKEIGVSE